VFNVTFNNISVIFCQSVYWWKKQPTCHKSV